MTDDTSTTSKRRKIRAATSSTILVAVLAGGVAVTNHVKVQAPMQDLLEGEARNSGIEVRVHYKHYLMPGTLVYDLREVSGDKAPADVFRVFLQFAAAMKDQSFDDVELAFRGETKFILDGAAFRKIGEEFGEQNPMYTVRTFPQRLQTPDGRRAFEVREGGALGVLSAQMDDFSEFNRRWYIDGL